MNQENGQSKFNPTLRPTAVIGGGTLGSRIALMLASSGGEVRLYDAKTAQLEIAERFIGTELPKLVKTRAGAVAGRVVMAKTLEPAIAGAVHRLLMRSQRREEVISSDGLRVSTEKHSARLSLRRATLPFT